MSARVISLHLHRGKGERPVNVDAVVGRIGGGIEGDSHVSKATRSLLIVDRSTLDDLGLAAGDLREQITIEGLRGVTTLAPGTRLRVGGLTVQVNGECKPCTHIGQMLEVDDPETFRLSLEGRRGAACHVVEVAGLVRVGDGVEVLAPVTA
jgi:MOSC domain-containing protein YiiM